MQCTMMINSLPKSERNEDYKCQNLPESCPSLDSFSIKPQYLEVKHYAYGWMYVARGGSIEENIGGGKAKN